MTRSLFTTAAGAILLAVAGCGPGDQDYQKVAEETPWRMRDSGSLPDCLARHTANYKFEKQVGGSAISVTAGGKAVFAHTPHGEPSFFEENGVFYYADYNTLSYGCKLLAYDLQGGRELWRTELKAIGPVNHSKYRNQVWIEPLDEATVIVFGNEAAGQYVEIVDRNTGKTVGHKVY